MKTLAKILVTGIAVLVIGNIMSSVIIEDYTAAIWVAAILALLNTFIKPLLVLFTLPVTILSMGLFLFAINAIIVMMASNLVSGFYVNGFFAALVFSLLLSLFRSFLFSVFFEKDETTRN